MNKKKLRLLRQSVLLTFLLIICLVSSGMIYLGSTVFRSQLPFFQLLDGNAEISSENDIDNEETDISQEINPENEVIDNESDVRLYMLLGSDYRPESGFRTDTLILVALDRSSNRASIVSFPRDLWVFIPGYGEQRINTVMQLGGFNLLADTLQYNFGVYPRQYAMINMAGFLEIIDVLGGVEFTTEYTTADACDGSLDPDRWCEVGPGLVSLNSDWALWYVRARYNSSDFERMRRTQEVIGAVVDKVLSPSGIIKLPALLSIYESEVESNINPDQVLPMVKLAVGFNFEEDVRRYSIGPNETTSWTTAQGAAVLLPNLPAIQLILQEALNFE